MTTCNLEDIFVSMTGMVKKKYRTRQSTGNWKRDELTVTEKVRTREGYSLMRRGEGIMSLHFDSTL